jgi:hypothetical protein
MNADQLSICPKCGSDACYKLPINETAFSYYCFGCGAHTTDLQKMGEIDLEQFESALPELYKDVKFVDEENRIWYPITINIASKGTVFLNGKSADTADWCAIKVRELTEAERAEVANRDLTHKSDSNTMKLFGNDFIEALDYINFFE